MRKFEITNTEKFTGTAVVIYTPAGVLCVIDCRKAEMDMDTLNHFRKAVPLLVDGLQTAFSGQTIVVESNYVITFEQFYNDYPYKRNRKRAEQDFKRLTTTEQVLAYTNLQHYKKFLQKSGSIPMMASSYLSRREFETEWQKIRN